jgi:hypothetical protein
MGTALRKTWKCPEVKQNWRTATRSGEDGNRQLLMMAIDIDHQQEKN